MGEGIAIKPLWETATAVANTDTITSDPIYYGRNKGLTAMLVVISGSSPEVNITRQVGLSADENATFYTPYDDAGNSEGTIASALTATRYFSFTPRTAPYVKFSITGTVNNGADTKVQAWLIFRESLRSAVY